MIEHPYNGSSADPNDVDELLAMYRAIKGNLHRLRETELALREAIAKHAIGAGKTREVLGRSLRAKVTFPSATWDSGALRRLAAKYPQYAEDFLSVTGYRPDIKKMPAGNNGDETFVEFRNKLLSAERPPTATPTVTVIED